MVCGLKIGRSSLFTSAIAKSTPIAPLIAHLRKPLFRNAYALILSSAATSGLGIVYWMLAARLYSAHEVGLNSALISTMTLLSGLAQLKLASSLRRFIPTAGRGAGWLVGLAYLGNLVMALAVSAIFILGLKWWAPDLAFLGSNTILKSWFIAATMMWGIFALQDGALTGLRQTAWVPLENALFGLAKIILLILFASSLPQYGIFASWTIPVVVTIILVNWLIFKQIVPRHAAATTHRATAVSPRQMARFAAGDYLGSLFDLLAMMFLPLLVIRQAGISANAYFYLSWTIVQSLNLVAVNMGASLTVEAATDETKLYEYGRQTLIQMGRILGPAALAMLIFAPAILKIFGATYAAEGALLFRLLTLAAVPKSINVLYMSLARARRQVTPIVVTQAVLCFLVLGSGYFLLEAYGIAGVGFGWFISQMLVAVALMLTQIRPLLRAQATGVFKAPVTSRISALVPRILATLPPQPGQPQPQPQQWRIQKAQQVETRTAVVITLGLPQEPPIALLKLAPSTAASANSRWQEATLATLHADSRLGVWRNMLPKQLAAGEIDGRHYAIVNMLPGTDARAMMSDAVTRFRFLKAAVTAIKPLHRKTVVTVTVDEALLTRWVDDPLRYLQAWNKSLPRLFRFDAALTRLQTELHTALIGRTLPKAWIHGDFHPGNLLTTADGVTITGILDWDRAAPGELPLLDYVHLLLFARRLAQGRELGGIVVRLLTGEGWTADEHAILDASGCYPADDAKWDRGLVLLTWLRHVATNLALQNDNYRCKWWWLAKNVVIVLRRL